MHLHRIFDDIISMDFWERLDEQINLAGKTRKEVAKDLGFTVGNFGSWKSRETYPTVDTVASIARYLGTTVEYLVTGESAAGWKPPKRIANIVDDLLELDDNGLEAVAVLARGLASRGVEQRSVSGGG